VHIAILIEKIVRAMAVNLMDNPVKYLLRDVLQIATEMI